MNIFRKSFFWFLIFLMAFEFLIARNLAFYGLAPTSSVGQISSLLKIFDRQDKEKIRWLVLGDSQSRDAIRPTLVARELGQDPGSIFNLSINAGKPTDFEYLLRQVVPRLPNLQGVIITVNEHYFDRKDVQYDPKFRFIAGLGDRAAVPGPERKADLVLSWLSYTYGMRLQWWETMKMVFRGETAPDTDAYPGGLAPVSDSTEEHYTVKYAKELSTSWLLDFRLPGPESGALERTLQFLDGQNLSWQMVYLPKTALIDRIIDEKFCRQEQEFFAYVEDLAARHRKKLYRDFPGLTYDCFRDVNHMNEKGAEKMAPRMGEIIRQMAEKKIS
ncbi:hypothetical protein [Candidatus Formimonas warabiya]|uniref:SGNH/GDSL hydrolase family protein n=1 Tax=Formimonas warabiya TaxID=1761012 RepID=A0A3G1KPY9_FORW1|nr:hypothetical protein [Candidatus Formimonas warabiya]ATW24521.1 hypothetical protein DCMF_06765 [Candidatus Formimonas warabiya]